MKRITSLLVLFFLSSSFLITCSTQDLDSDDTGQGEFSEIENLQLVSPDFFDAVSKIITFENNQTILIFVAPTCNDTASCIRTQTFNKQ